MLFAGFARVAGADTQVGATLPPPDQLYGDLFVAVQTAQIYPDQKTFVDALPKADATTILQAYDAQKNESNFSLKTFVDQYFTPPSEPMITPPPNQSLRDHINWLWPELTRTTTSAPPYSSLIPMPRRMSCRAAVFARATTGTRTSRCWACRNRDMKISSTTCSTTSRT
jgi:alpha,alpha-trehalase